MIKQEGSFTLLWQGSFTEQSIKGINSSWLEGKKQKPNSEFWLTCDLWADLGNSCSWNVCSGFLSCKICVATCKWTLPMEEAERSWPRELLELREKILGKDHSHCKGGGDQMGCISQASQLVMQTKNFFWSSHIVIKYWCKCIQGNFSDLLKLVYHIPHLILRFNSLWVNESFCLSNRSCFLDLPIGKHQVNFLKQSFSQRNTLL